MTELTPAQLAIRRRNRNMLVALFVLFFGGMLIAGLLRFSGWRPEGSKNRGEMLQPYGDLREYVPTLADGSAYGWKDEPRIWRIVAMPPPAAVPAAVPTYGTTTTRCSDGRPAAISATLPRQSLILPLYQ